MLIFDKFLIKKYPLEENYFLSEAKEIEKIVNIPVAYWEELHLQMLLLRLLKITLIVIVGRYFIHDPYFLNKIKKSMCVSPCNHCNEYLVEMDKSGVKGVFIKLI